MSSDMETCRRCGKTGYKIDEFLEYWTGLCKPCYEAVQATGPIGLPPAPATSEYNPNNLYGGTTCNGKTIRDIYHKMPEDWRLVNTIWYMAEFRVPVKGDWYLQPHSHLATMCHGTERMRPRIILKERNGAKAATRGIVLQEMPPPAPPLAPYRAPAPTPPPAPSGKNQPEQVRRFTRQNLEVMESAYRVLGREALTAYLETHVEEILHAIRAQVRQDEEIENGVQMAMMRAMEREREEKKRKEEEKGCNG